MSSSVIARNGGGDPERNGAGGSGPATLAPSRYRKAGQCLRAFAVERCPSESCNFCRALSTLRVASGASWIANSRPNKWRRPVATRRRRSSWPGGCGRPDRPRRRSRGSKLLVGRPLSSTHPASPCGDYDSGEATDHRSRNGCDRLFLRFQLLLQTLESSRGRSPGSSQSGPARPSA